MKSITEILGGAQALLDINFDLQKCFEENLTDEYKTFLHMLRVIEESQQPIQRARSLAGRPPYTYEPFIRSMWAMRYFRIEKVSTLIQRLKGEPNLRLLCGFDKVPDKSVFSRYFAALAETDVM